MAEIQTKCILFSRVSTLQQSLESQTDSIKNEALRLGYNENNLILIEQKESAVKLDIEERIGIQQLKHYIENDKNIDCVIVYEISRLARRPKILYEIRDYLLDHNIQLICIKPYIQLIENGKLSNTASLIFGVFSTLAEEEARLSKERMRRGRMAKRDQLKYIGGYVLFGYTWDNDNDKIYINEEERDTVVEIFERYTRGESIRQISKDLIDRGKLRYDNYSTACVMLRKMIRRPEYAGIKGKTYPYPAIISQELYYKVREKAESRNKYIMRIQGIYYLQGLIHWKTNGMLMSPYKYGVQYKAWDENTNSGTMINMDYIESLVWHFVVEYKKRISGPEKVQMVKSLIDEMMHNNQRYQKTIEERMNIEKTIERINERVVKGKMSEIQGDKLIEEQQLRIKELDNITIKYGEDNKQLQSQLDNIRNNIDDYDNINEEQKNRIIRECVKRVDVDKDGDKSTGKIIEIYMIDGTKHTIHMYKKGMNFISNIIYKDKEEPLKDLQLIKRFIRKKYGKA